MDLVTIKITKARSYSSTCNWFSGYDDDGKRRFRNILSRKRRISDVSKLEICGAMMPDHRV